MTWTDELSVLSIGGVLVALGYWIVYRISERVEGTLKQIVTLLDVILNKLEKFE